MPEQLLYRLLLAVWLALPLPVFLLLLKIPAPYGRHRRRGWGPEIPARLGWILMESPAALVFLFVFLIGEQKTGAFPLALLALWEVHYVYRSFLYPFLSRRVGTMPFSIAAMAFGFNVTNAYLNGRYLFHFGPETPPGDMAVVAGSLLYVTGLLTHVWADQRLRGLRAPGDARYRVPSGSLFELVSCPNYLGEIVQWTGWVLLTWSLPGLGFALWTVANLMPRALSHHRWYRQNFPAYPPRRKALVPFVI